MRKPVSVVKKGEHESEFLVFCDDGSVWRFFLSTGEKYLWSKFGDPLPGSLAASSNPPLDSDT